MSKEEISKESERIEESSKFSAQAQFAQAKLWRGVNLLVGVPAAVLAALAGASGLASATNRYTAAYLALAAAGFGALLTVLNANRRMQQAHAAANAYLEIQTAARQLRLIDLPNLTYDDARSELQELTARRDEINKTADIPAWIAYVLGKAQIKKGRQDYEIDKEGSNGNNR